MKTNENVPGWNDIVFQNRNKEYGAYELRSQYQNRLSKAFIIVLTGLVILLSILFIARSKYKTENKITLDDSVIFSEVSVAEFIHPQEIKRQILSSPQNPILNSIFAFSDTIQHLISDTTTVVLNGTSSDSVTGNSKTGLISDTILPTGNSANKQEFYNTSTVEKNPEFPGGMEKFYRFLKKRIRYTEEAIRAKLAKKIYIRFIVDEAGLVTDIKILNKAGYGLDEEVYKALLASPKWTPGIVRNESVKTEMILPVNFSLVQ